MNHQRPINDFLSKKYPLLWKFDYLFVVQMSFLFNVLVFINYLVEIQLLESLTFLALLLVFLRWLIFLMSDGKVSLFIKKKNVIFEIAKINLTTLGIFILFSSPLFLDQILEGLATDSVDFGLRENILLNFLPLLFAPVFKVNDEKIKNSNLGLAFFLPYVSFFFVILYFDVFFKNVFSLVPGMLYAGVCAILVCYIILFVARKLTNVIIVVSIIAFVFVAYCFFMFLELIKLEGNTLMNVLVLYLLLLSLAKEMLIVFYRPT